ncbi:unnamed protein product [Closterium sp. NIES-53]
MSNCGAEKKKERTTGQFFHIREQGEQRDASAKVVAGAGRAAFKGADGKPVKLHNVLLLPNIKANLIFLRKLANAGMSTSTDGARTYKGKLGNRVLWDLHESKDLYRSIQIWGDGLGNGTPTLGACRSAFVEAWIRTDWGGEFLRVEMMAWLKKQGIQREMTTAYTSQSIGVAERANRTILETARALLIESGVGNSMWPHAVRLSIMAWNRVLTKCVHLGLAAESKEWLLWEPFKGVLFDSRDLKFVDGLMYGSKEKQPEARVSQQMEQITMQLDLTPSVWEEGEEAAAEGGDGERVQEAPAGGGGGVCFHNYRLMHLQVVAQ